MTVAETVQGRGWLAAALAQTPRRTAVAVDDEVALACSVWEPPGAAPTANLLLLHGNAAQKEWWDAIAPVAAEGARVVAMDLTGHGDSPHRGDYTFAHWSAEVAAVTAALCADAPTVLVGHSLGGLIALAAAWDRPGRYAGVITLDTPLRRYTPQQLAKRHAIAQRPLQRHPRLDDAVAAFRTVPDAVDAPPALLAHIAEHAHRRGDGGWVLKLDPALYARTTDVDAFLRPFPPHTYCVRAEHGFIDESMLAEIAPHTAGADRIVTVPAVGHNLLIEAPLATAWMIRALSAQILRDPVRAQR